MNLVIKGFNQNPEKKMGKITSIKAMRQISGMGIKEAKDFVEDLPRTYEVNDFNDVIILVEGGLQVELSQEETTVKDNLMAAAKQAMKNNEVKICYDVLKLVNDYYGI